MMRKLWHTCLFLSLAGCAHQSTVTPSQGHIGSVENAPTAAAPPMGDIPKPVKKPSYVPPPKPKVREQTYSVVVSDVPVREILFALARESKMNIDIHPAISGNVTLNAVDQTLPSILDRLAKQVDLIYKIEGNSISITPDIPTLRTYKVNYVNMSRDTKSTIGVAAEIASTGAAASAATGGGGSSISGSKNNSNTTVDSKSQNNFWEVLSDNIRNILRTTKSQTATAYETMMLQTIADKAMEQASSSSDQTSTSSAERQAAERAQKDLIRLAKDQISKVNEEVIVNAVAGTVTVMATERQHQFIQQYLDTVMAAAQRQVLIETTIVEVTLNDEFQTGIDWSRLGSRGGNKGFTFEQTLGPRATRTSGVLDNPNFVVGYFNTAGKLGDIAASIKLLETFGSTKVLSSPKLMALNNQTAILKVVDNLVYFTVKTDVTATQGVQTQSRTSTPHTVPVGVVMSVTPQINENGSVTLNVRPTISRKLPGNGIPDPVNEGSFIPQIQVREMESVLQVSSGQTVVLGGLMQDEVARNTDAVPTISKLPLLGKLFEGKNHSARKSELVIFIRPSVIPNASLESEELKAFKQFLPEQLPVITTDEPAD
ncbi:MAG: pilus (MSHA type) biogenesis protein MshL [Methylophilaceae bacterium]|nr:pilus (MSHA type) biogenesis protein MshL [Methylophilaceae bacterium]